MGLIKTEGGHSICAISRTGSAHCYPLPAFHLEDFDTPPPQTIELFRDDLFTDLITSFRAVCARHVEGHWVCEDIVDLVEGAEQQVIVMDVDPLTAGINAEGKLLISGEERLPGDQSPPGRFVDVYSSAGYTCAIRDDDTVFCDESFRPYDDYRLRGLEGLDSTEYYLITPKPTRSGSGGEAAFNGM